MSTTINVENKNDINSIKQALEDLYYEAITKDELDLNQIEIILSKYRLFGLIPSQDCLSETIYWNHKHLALRLMDEPYCIEPDVACLSYSIKNQDHDLIEKLLELDIEVEYCCLQYAITACNIKLVTYFIEELNVPVDSELEWDIENNPQPHDDFSPEERINRNKIIKNIIERNVEDSDSE
jgi:hypothetical protein